MSARRWLIAGLLLIAAATAWALLAFDAEVPGAVPQPGPQRSTARIGEPPVLRSSDAPATGRKEEQEEAEDDGLFIDVVNATDGAPLEGAGVYVGWTEDWYYIHHRGRSGFHTQTDAKGRAKVKVPRLYRDPADDAPRTLYLKVTKPYFRAHKQRFEPGMVALEPLEPWRGRVLTSARTPAAGATVSAAHHDDVHTRTDAEGRFELRLPHPDKLFAELNGEVTTTAEELVEGEEVELVLAKPPQQEGVVVGRDGAPLAGVTLTITARATTWQQTTGRDGVFRVPALDSVATWLRFEKSGYVTKEGRFDEEIVLSRSTTLEGTLLDQSKRPVSGFKVILRGAGEELYGADHRITFTGVDGRFAFEELDLPEVTLTALPAAGEESGDDDDDDDDDEERNDSRDRGELLVRLPEGETTRVVMVLPPKREPVQVEYQSITGFSVRGCNTTATPVPPSGWVSHTGGWRDELLLTRGRFLFEVVCYDKRTASEERDIDPAREKVLRFVVRGDGTTEYEDEKPAEQVTVRVVRPDGTPVSGARVNAYDTEGTTGGDGRFSFEVRASDPLWPLQVSAASDGASGATRVMKAGEEATIVLRPRVTIQGRVDGAMPPGQWHVAVRSSEETSEELLNGTTFVLDDRSAVRTFICIERTGGGESIGCAVWEGGGSEVVIRVGTPGSFRFVAVDATGAPITQPVVYVDRVALYAVNAPQGEVTLKAGPGEHVLIINVHGSRARHEARFTVKPGAVTDLGPLRVE